MDTRYYHAQDINIEQLAAELDRVYAAQGHQTQHFGNADTMTVQIKKGGEFAALFGLQSALTVVMQRAPDGMQAMVGQQRWADKAAVGAVGFIFPVLWPLMLTAGAGAVMQASLGSQVLNTLDMLVHQRYPNAQQAAQQAYAPPFFRHSPFGPFGPFGAPSQAPQQAAPVICPNCQTANEPGDKFCMQCGKPLTTEPAEKAHCANCGAEMKPGAAYCTKCGTAAEAA
jgi:hypothetical protein